MSVRLRVVRREQLRLLEPPQVEQLEPDSGSGLIALPKRRPVGRPQLTLVRTVVDQ